jgi:hypothetical protein
VTGKSNKKGDIIVDIEGDEKKRIVVECKNASNYTVKKTLDEIKEAIDNRNATFGIFLFSGEEKMPSQFNCIKITDSYIITYMDNENLHFAYRLARSLVKCSNAACNDIDTSKIQTEVKKIEELVANIDSMQKKVTQIINSGEYLKTELQKLYTGIHNSINNIELSINSEAVVTAQ